jgi:SAM-dependent methyltransferase
MSYESNLSLLSAPSSTLMKFADVFNETPENPILDVGSGYGRNAVALAIRGRFVICVDRDISRLRVLRNSAPKFIAKGSGSGAKCYGSIHPVCAEISEERWPFPSNRFSTIICVHFLDVSLFGRFAEALVTGGNLYIETFENRGGNYLDLPQAGQLHDLLSKRFSIQFYEEKKAGPPSYDAVTAKVLCKKT